MAAGTSTKLNSEDKRLRAKQLRFIDEYLTDQNVASATIRAGYKAKHPKTAGQKLLANPKIQHAMFARCSALVAAAAIRPTSLGASTIKAYGETEWPGAEWGEFVDALSEQVKAVRQRSLDRGEAMLAVQAHTLDAIFNRLANFAIKAKEMPNFETYLKLALRAQSQCRATWEAISGIQNPPLASYVNQANIAHGHQQVNYGSPPSFAREEGKSAKQTIGESQNALSDWMDRRAPETASSNDSKLEAVEKIDRSTNA